MPGVTPVQLEKALPGPCDPGYLGTGFGDQLEGERGEMLASACPRSVKLGRQSCGAMCSVNPVSFNTQSPFFPGDVVSRSPSRLKAYRGGWCCLLEPELVCLARGKKYGFLVSKQGLTLLPLKCN